MIAVSLISGADPQALTDMVNKWSAAAATEASGDAAPEETGLPKGQISLNPFIDASGTECLNESDDHKITHAFEAKGGFLESDVDAQLLMTIGFNQLMKIHSLKVVADGPKAPKTIKLFANLPNSPDFDSAESMTAVQEFTLTDEDMKEESIINLKYVKFQSISSLTMFVKDNQGDEETTQIQRLLFIGSPVSTTNMNDFKRVAGKAGESH